MTRRRLLLGPLVILVGCGGITAEHPLTVPLGIQRDRVTTELAKHKYCHATPDGPPATVETFPRCHRPGTEWGESWVTARFDHDRLIELRRYERFSDDAVATERWNQLVADRSQVTPASDEAGSTLRGKLLEPGTRMVRAFRVDAETIVGVYLLTPTPPEQASILEAVIRVPRS
ncbi:MAG: hypothetical protein H6Q90_1853 [Deltaproteobacteria bacterium]|nr:hypothetical protein [Deltaproteobacteria bacterium]